MENAHEIALVLSHSMSHMPVRNLGVYRKHSYEETGYEKNKKVR
jgi:hypothetical protein